MLLALGLNVVVGWAGLLDLGYVAFFGFGAYVYAMLSSTEFDASTGRRPASIPVVVAVALLLGLLLGCSSRRLVGDYLAIVTLFFGQLFVTVNTNGDRSRSSGSRGYDLTGGPNGIADIDPLGAFGAGSTRSRQLAATTGSRSASSRS